MSKLDPKGKKVYVSVHPHYLLLKGKEERYAGKEGKNYYWICDVCKIEACDSVYSFHCKDCGYDFCSRCFEKFFEVREKDSCCKIF